MKPCCRLICATLSIWWTGKPLAEVRNQLPVLVPRAGPQLVKADVVAEHGRPFLREEVSPAAPLRLHKVRELAAAWNEGDCRLHPLLGGGRRCLLRVWLQAGPTFRTLVAAGLALCHRQSASHSSWLPPSATASATAMDLGGHMRYFC